MIYLYKYDECGTPTEKNYGYDSGSDLCWACYCAEIRRECKRKIIVCESRKRKIDDEIKLYSLKIEAYK